MEDRGGTCVPGDLARCQQQNVLPHVGRRSTLAQTMDLSTGYNDFHRHRFINYQLNRWYSLGYPCKEDIAEAGRHIRSFRDYVRVFLRLGERALAEGRLKHAAFHRRAADCLVDPEDPSKLPRYQKFQALRVMLAWLQAPPLSGQDKEPYGTPV